MKNVNLTALAAQAAGALDLTHDLDGRGPKTFEARKFLATWLDTGRGSVQRVRRDIAWLRNVVKQYTYGKPRGLYPEQRIGRYLCDAAGCNNIASWKQISGPDHEQDLRWLCDGHKHDLEIEAAEYDDADGKLDAMSL